MYHRCVQICFIRSINKCHINPNCLKLGVLEISNLISKAASADLDISFGLLNGTGGSVGHKCIWLLFTVHVLRECLSIFVCPFPFGFEGGMWV